MRGRRTRIARGVYRDRSGYSVIWRSAGKPKEKRFPLDTPLDTMKKHRARELQGAPRFIAGAGFVRDALQFLKGRRALASFKSDRAHLRPWMRRFAKRSRYMITADEIRAAIAEWQSAGYAPRELRHRRRILSQFFESFDTDGPNPCRKVKTPKVPKTRPRSVAVSVVREVALNLRKQEFKGIGRLRDSKTRARYLVLATTGQRPAQLRRAKPGDVDLERRIWFVEPAKGDNGAIVYLNDDMVAAWTLFISANAWGAYDGRSFVKTLRRNGWPKGIDPYTLRHTVGLTLSELGVDLGDIQAHMGHSSPATTRQFYVPGVPQRLKAASEKLDGRLSIAAAVPRTGSMNRSERSDDKRKTLRKTRRA